MEGAGQDVELEGTEIRRDRAGRMKRKGNSEEDETVGDENVGTKLGGTESGGANLRWERTREERKSGVEGARGGWMRGGVIPGRDRTGGDATQTREFRTQRRGLGVEGRGKNRDGGLRKAGGTRIQGAGPLLAPSHPRR